MESLQCDIHMTAEHVIVSKAAWSLWCGRSDGSLKPGSVVTPANLESAHYLGKCYGLVGKIQFFSGGEWKLLLIGSVRSVGVLPLCGNIYCIQKLIVIPLTTDPSPEILGLEWSQKDPSPSGGGGGRKGSSGRQDSSGSSGGGGSSASTGRLRDVRDKDKLERRLMEALLRMFNDSQSFYFSPDGDITRTQQRKVDQGSGSLSNSPPPSSSSSPASTSNLPMWSTVDDRFFWNKWMLQDLLDISSVLQYSTSAISLVEPWIQPIVQGYVEIHTLLVHSSNPPNHLQNSLKGSDRGHTGREGGGGSGDGGEGEVCKGKGGGGGGGGEGVCKGGGGGEGVEKGIEEEVEEEDMIVFSPLPDVSPGGDEDNGHGVCSKGEPSGSHSEMRPPGISGGGDGTSLSGGRERFPIPDIRETDYTDEDQNRISESERASRLNEELAEVKSSPPEGVKERGKKLLERLKLTRRSTSPDRGEGREEVGEKGGMAGVDTGRGLPGERLVMVERGGEENGEMEGETGDRKTGERRSEKDKDDEEEEEEKTEEYSFTLALVSRRSRHRAGTRYRRRGVDAQGKVANFVETEMILQAGSHHASYVLVRGSVPVFWTQPGTKYRPPPVIERGEEETQEAFQKHLEEQLHLYNHVAITSLINQSGRESVLGQAFEKHVLTLDSPHITYITFDFHRHFKADQAGAIQRLVTATHSLNKKFRFCWVDTNISSGPLCRQDGVFRVNCMDCLDRTNVVQTALCKEVLQSVLQKLGIIPFDEQLSGAMLTTYKLMWANNGDYISRQYTGTDAMKGDLTRYGERKFSGMMKDGYNSAHRYYQNLFRDSYRQVLIDLMQGVSHSDAFYSLPLSLRGRRGEEEDEEDEEEELWSLDREQAIAEMVRFCREELFPTKTLTMVGWALVEAAGYSFVESSRKEEDCVLLQCKEQNQLCVASYNVEDDQVNCFIRIPMQKVEKIVIGPLGTILRSSQKRLHMRLYYTLMDSRQCHFTLKTVNFTSMEEDRDILFGIASTLSNLCPTILVQEQKLTKKRSPTHLGVIHLVVPKELAMEEWGRAAALSSRTNSDLTQTDEQEELEEGLDGEEQDEEVEEEEEEEEEEDEREISFSVPASPTLTRRHHPPPPPHPAQRRVQRLRSQSFDDIIFNINNEDDDDELPSPVSMATTEEQQGLVSSVSARNLIFGTSPARLDSRSDSSTEHLPRHGLGTVYDHTQLVSSQPEMAAATMGEKSSSRGGRLNQLKGKLLGRRGRNSKASPSSDVPLQLMKLNSDSINSDTTDSTRQDTGSLDDPTVVEDTTGSSLSSVQSKQSQVAHRLMAVGQRFKNAPPSLLRKMGVGSSVSGLGNHVAQTPPTDNHNEIDGRISDARNSSKTNFIIL